MRNQRSRSGIGTIGLLAIVFFTVSGGPYGLEPLVGSLGGGRALVLLVAVPVLWSLPVALMAAELTSAMPVLGGYYQWVRRALGDFWGFQEGWWSWLFTWVDMPLYPVLCAEILREAWPTLAGRALPAGHTAAIALVFLWAAALVNWSGVRVVAGWAVAAGVAVLAPFVAFMAAAGTRAAAVHGAGPGVGAGMEGAAWAVGLSTVMWNYAGWDNVSTFAPEVRNPQRTYPRALLGALGLITAFYVGSVWAGLRLDPVAAHWSNGYFAVLGGRSLGAPWGHWLAATMAATAVLSTWTQYVAQLPYVLPLPASLALDGHLPAWLARTNRRGVRTPALLVCSLVFSLFALASFAHLVVADVLLYSAGLTLEFAALVVLRRRGAGERGRFRVPLSGRMLAALGAAPLALAGINLAVDVRQERLFSLLALGLLASGPVLWAVQARRRTAAGPRPSPARLRG